MRISLAHYSADMRPESHPSDLHLAVAGMIALAVAMGIGRFAFTPVLPLMQTDLGVTIAQGGWLASANYLGYLVGAVVATRPGPSPCVLLRAGLVLVVVTTAAMAFPASWPLWAMVRFAAGVASAWVLIGTAALCLGRLAEPGRSKLSGIVFAGVGLGIAIAGVLCQGTAIAGWNSRTVWWALAVVAGLGTTLAWYGLAARSGSEPGSYGSSPAVATGVADRRMPTAGGPILVLCYGLFGFGYILPATFLPAQGRALIDDPAVFGWIWPVFGLAAMASTLLAARHGGTSSRRDRWAAAQIVMAAGVVLPVIWEALAALILAALCVGGTFMIVTMIGMQEARAVAGANAQSLMAAMTAAFATGQLLGPLAVGATSTLGWPIEATLLLAAAGLVASTLLLGVVGRSTVHTQEEGR
jgi:predicted MFS family arabinose efflux permease